MSKQFLTARSRTLRGAAVGLGVSGLVLTLVPGNAIGSDAIDRGSADSTKSSTASTVDRVGKNDRSPYIVRLKQRRAVKTMDGVRYTLYVRWEDYGTTVQPVYARVRRDVGRGLDWTVKYKIAENETKWSDSDRDDHRKKIEFTGIKDEVKSRKQKYDPRMRAWLSPFDSEPDVDLTVPFKCYKKAKPKPCVLDSWEA